MIVVCEVRPPASIAKPTTLLAAEADRVRWRQVVGDDHDVLAQLGELVVRDALQDAQQMAADVLQVLAALAQM